MKSRLDKNFTSICEVKVVNNIFRTKVSATCASTLLGIVIVLGGLPINSASAQRECQICQTDPNPSNKLQFLTMEANNPKADIEDLRLFAAGRCYNQALNYYYKQTGSQQEAIKNALNAANLFAQFGDMINRQKALDLVSLLH